MGKKVGKYLTTNTSTIYSLRVLFKCYFTTLRNLENWQQVPNQITFIIYYFVLIIAKTGLLGKTFFMHCNNIWPDQKMWRWGKEEVIEVVSEEVEHNYAFALKKKTYNHPTANHTYIHPIDMANAAIPFDNCDECPLVWYPWTHRRDGDKYTF